MNHFGQNLPSLIRSGLHVVYIYRYWAVDGDVVSVWLAVDDADQENGCMQVIPGESF